MATVRKRSSGFSDPQDKEEEAHLIEELLDESAREMFETISLTETESQVKSDPVAPTPFVPQEIVPTEDCGPRFVEEKSVPAPAPQLQPPPKRHPRNVPKFSRLK